jgi:hypothetical protein
MFAVITNAVLYVWREKIYKYSYSYIFHPGSRNRIKEFKYFLKNGSKPSEICAGLNILDPDPDFFIHPGSRGQKAPDPGS